MAVALKNTNKRRPAGPFNLPAEHVGADKCETVEMQVSSYNPETETQGFRTVRQTICPSLRFEAGEVKTGLPDGTLEAPEIVAAIKRGELMKLS